MWRRRTRPDAARRLLVDGVDSLFIDPRSTSGQPDGWGWDWERWKECPNNPVVIGAGLA